MPLSVSNLSKTYKRRSLTRMGFSVSEVRALTDFSLEFPAGKTTVILGHNGAGKTTLLKILAGVLLPDSGKISRTASKTAYIYGDERSFYWRLTGRQNLEFFGALSNLYPKQLKTKIEEVAAQLGLKELDRPYQEYSSGIRQRLAIARALLLDAEIILMDEPTKSLDPIAADIFRRLLLEQLIRYGKTVVLATHDLREAALLGDFFCILAHGKTQNSGAMPEIDRHHFLDQTYQTVHRTHAAVL